ncbi:MAG TPA: hypothetical protein VLB51_03520 [Methylomirabilota bacterium]|nr:hypothetical protein [Methylomirabilota bacterium]
MKKVAIAAGLIVAFPILGFAVLSFQQLDGNTFTISHQVKWIGGRNQAMELVFEKAASLCLAAGYSHFEIIDQASHAGGGFQAPNATITVKFFLGPGENRVDCEGKATEEYIEQASKKLEKRGYQGPVGTKPPVEPAAADSQCSVEQISAMVKAGLTDDQIRAACEKEPELSEPGES